MNTRSEYLIDVAKHDFEAALEELNRPSHDVVTHSVCHLTRVAIGSFLRLYLESKNLVTFESESLEDLIAICETDNGKFKNFDFSVLACSHLSFEENPSNYCLSDARVRNCFELLTSLKTYYSDELKLI